MYFGHFSLNLSFNHVNSAHSNDLYNISIALRSWLFDNWYEINHKILQYLIINYNSPYMPHFYLCGKLTLTL